MDQKMKQVTLSISAVIVATLLVLSAPVVSFTQDNGTGDTLPTSSGTRVYIIKEGDTLWEISDDLYNDPSNWRELWEMNPQLGDPNNLTVGDELYLDGGTATETSTTETTGTPYVTESVVGGVTEEVTLPTGLFSTESMKETLPAESFKMEPEDVYFIPKIIYTGFVSEEELEDSGYIHHTRDEKVMLSDDDVVFIKLPEDRMVELKQNDKFTIFRVEEKVKHPVTRKKIGYHINIVGELNVTAVGEKTASAIITNSSGVVFVDDRIRPFEPLVKTIELKKGKAPVVGYIIHSCRADTEMVHEQILSENDIVYIDRGFADGVEVGSVFDILRIDENNTGELTAEGYEDMLRQMYFEEGISGKEILEGAVPKHAVIYPPDVVGRLVVLNAGEYKSTAVISSSNRSVVVGDMVRLELE
jgi:hypothetical protein